MTTFVVGADQRRRERVGEEGDRRSGYDTYILYTIIWDHHGTGENAEACSSGQ